MYAAMFEPNEGLIRVDRGQGTFVAASPISYAIGKRVLYNRALKVHGYEPSLKGLRVQGLPDQRRRARPVGSAALALAVPPQHCLMQPWLDLIERNKAFNRQQHGSTAKN